MKILNKNSIDLLPHTSQHTERKPPIYIIAYKDNTDLREVSWNQKYLDSIKKEYDLKHCQSVLFINIARDRFRLVVCFYGFAMLLLPPTNSADRISLYLKIGDFLKRFAGRFDDAINLLDREIELASQRLERRKHMALKAQSKRKIH